MRANTYPLGGVLAHHEAVQCSLTLNPWRYEPGLRRISDHQHARTGEIRAGTQGRLSGYCLQVLL